MIGARHRHLKAFDPTTRKTEPVQGRKKGVAQPRKPRATPPTLVAPKPPAVFGPSRLSKSVPGRTDFSLDVEIKCEPVSLRDKRNDQCSWPLDSGLYCGRTVVFRKSYCAAHVRISGSSNRAA